MNAIAVPFGLILLCAELICGALSLIAVPTLCGYFFARIVLKVMGLHSASEEQAKGEIRFAAICGTLLLITFILVFLVAWLAGD
jgi:hypothetical protein